MKQCVEKCKYSYTTWINNIYFPLPRPLRTGELDWGLHIQYKTNLHHRTFTVDGKGAPESDLDHTGEDCL